MSLLTRRQSSSVPFHSIPLCSHAPFGFEILALCRDCFGSPFLFESGFDFCLDALLGLNGFV
jgi:hypothetical protein